jgi:hypothetical protein
LIGLCTASALTTCTFAASSLLKPNVVGLSREEQQVFLNTCEEKIRQTSELNQLRFLLEGNGYVGTVHRGNKLPVGYLSLGSKIYGQQVSPGQQKELIVVSYGHQLKSTYDFVFNSKKELLCVYCIPEG